MPSNKDGEGYPDEDALRAQQEKLDKARHARYRFDKFPKIRSSNDWVKGTWFNKKTVEEQMLVWQNKTIPKSITKLDPSLSKIATHIHKCILGCCNDKAARRSFSKLAQDILHKGFEYRELADEIYIQLCKQLSSNPKPESVGRCWQILCMCVGTFPPSSDFEMYLLNFILSHVDTPGLVGGYAQYAKRRLEGMTNSGASGFIPSVAEIEAYKERPPILATIELVDGAPITEDLPITPDLNVGKVLEICTNFLDLQDPRLSSFGMFVVDIPFEDEDVNKPGEKVNPLMGAGDKAPPPPPPAAWALPRTPCPLRSEDYMGDVVVKKRRDHRNFKFVFKRKIFLKNQDSPSDDGIFNHLMFLQATDEVIYGNIPIADEDEAVSLITQSVAADYQAAEDVLPDDVATLLADPDDGGGGLMEYVPVPWREKHSPEEWAELVIAKEAAQQNMNLDEKEIKGAYVDSVKQKELYGTCFFHVKKVEPDDGAKCDLVKDLPDLMILGVWWIGL